MRSYGFTTKTIVLLLAALALLSALGYWGIHAYRSNQVLGSVTALVKDTSERLQVALAVEAATARPESGDTVRALDTHAQEVDKHVIELRSIRASDERDLVNAAEEYMLTVRQILRNQAASHRYHIQVVSSEETLRDHMKRANRRSSGWIKEAVSAKERLERAYFDYRLSADAFGRLLGTYPDTRGKLAPLVGSGILLDDGYVADVRKQAQDKAKRTAEAVERARRLAAVR